MSTISSSAGNASTTALVTKMRNQLQQDQKLMKKNQMYYTDQELDEFEKRIDKNINHNKKQEPQFTAGDCALVSLGISLLPVAASVAGSIASVQFIQDVVSDTLPKEPEKKHCGCMPVDPFQKFLLDQQRVEYKPELLKYRQVEFQ